MTQKLNEDWVDKLAEKIYSFVTNQKRDSLYHMAKSDPKLAKELKGMERNFAELKKNLAALEKYNKS